MKKRIKHELDDMRPKIANLKNIKENGNFDPAIFHGLSLTLSDVEDDNHNTQDRCTELELGDLATGSFGDQNNDLD